MIKRLVLAAIFLLVAIANIHAKGKKYSVEISGADPVWEGSTATYRATFTGIVPTNITFTASAVNGTVQSFTYISSNVAIITVQWNCLVSSGSVSVDNLANFPSAVTTFNVTLLTYFRFGFCNSITPALQGLLPGDIPASVTIDNCSPYCTAYYGFQYQWQVGDVPVGTYPQTPASFTNISGAAGVSYQPPTSTVPAIKAYRRVTNFTYQGTPITVNSLTALVKFRTALNPGTIAGGGLIYGNNIPIITETAASGSGLCLSYDYTWESSENNGTWTIIGTGENYPSNVAITVNTQYRRKVVCDDQTAYTNTVSFTIAAPLDPGQLFNGNYDIPLPIGSVPGITNTAATGGLCDPANYIYTWEWSVENGPWQVIGTGVNYPGTGLAGNSRYRRKVSCNGEEMYTNIVLQYMEPYTYPNLENQNYVRENSIAVPNVNTWMQADNLATGDKLQTTTYLDGLGRSIQKVVKEGSFKQSSTSLDPNNVANYQDLVKTIKYDDLGRADETYIPYATSTNQGFYKDNPYEQQTSVNARYGEPNLSPYVHSTITYDGSPLNRVINIKAPGYAWNTDPSYKGMTTDYTIYQANEGVRIWSVGYNAGDVPVVDLTLYPTGIYPDFALIKNIFKDDKDKLTVEYKDLNGNVILKKVQEKEGANIDLNGYTGWLCTYYVYDDFNHLRYTITPKAVASMAGTGNWTVDTDTKKGLCFYQEYDAKGRVIVKHSPDGGDVWLVYDNRNRLVFSQDENQRNRINLNPAKTNQWSFSLYDDNDRVLATGLTDDSYNKSRTDMQVMVDNLSLTAQNKTITVYTGVTENIVAYNPVAGSSGSTDVCSYCQYTTINSISYYDAYNSNSKTYIATSAGDFAPTADPYVEQPAGPSKRIKGMATTTKIRVLDANSATSNPLDDKFLTTTVFIDDKGRVIQTQNDNIKGGTDVTSMQYNFAGQVLSTNSRHNVTGSPFNNLLTVNKYSYDLLGRPTKLFKSYGSVVSDELIKYKKLSEVSYDDVGRIKTKSIGNDLANTSNPLETMDYSYNIQGWLTGINKDYALADGTNGSMTDQWSRHFGMYLGYENADGKLSNSVAKQFSGNIMGAIWRSQGDNTPRKYEYEYDNINRFTAAHFNQKDKPSGTSVWATNLVDLSVSIGGYDANGNIAGMLQTGIVPGTNGGVVIDNLQYQYFDKSNKLKAVNDLAFGGNQTLNGKQGDFKDYTPSNNIDYGYDWNGNLKYDKNRTIIDPSANVTDNDPAAGITNNFLDLPEKIVIKDKSKTEYIYDASGTKLAKTVTQLVASPPPAKTTYYVGEFVYEDNDLQYILNEEGRLRIIEPVAAWSGPSGQVNYLETHGNVKLNNTKWGVWDYFIKDNLSNTRMVLTEEYQQQQMRCTMEDANTTVRDEEQGTFGNTTGNEVANTRVATPPGWTNAGNSSYKVSKLINQQTAGGTPGSVGPNVLLKVMAGDKLNAIANYYYQNPGTAAGNSNILSTIVGGFINAITGGTAASGILKDNSTAIGNVNNSPTSPLNNFLNSQPSPIQSTTPKAYMNVLFFDEQFRYVSENSIAVMVDEISAGSSIAKPLVLPTNTTVPKDGYVYIYLSNESTNIPVYFDDIQVNHTRGSIIEDNTYYPYGLKIQGISAKAALKPQTRYGYQGDYSEQDEETGYNEFALRHYDPQIGRWNQVDPNDVQPGMYNGMDNNPISIFDPTGGEGNNWYINQTTKELHFFEGDAEKKGWDNKGTTYAGYVTGSSGTNLFLGFEDGTHLLYLEKVVVKASTQTRTMLRAIAADLATEYEKSKPSITDANGYLRKWNYDEDDNAFGKTTTFFGNTFVSIFNGAKSTVRSAANAANDPGQALQNASDGVDRTWNYAMNTSWDNQVDDVKKKASDPNTYSDILATATLAYATGGRAGTVSEVEQYTLRAAEDGFYPVMKRGFRNPQELQWLEQGEAWKFGTTKNPTKRYTQSWLRSSNLIKEREFLGSGTDAIKLQNMKIQNYFEQTGHLPPGNKIIN